MNEDSQRSIPGYGPGGFPMPPLGFPASPDGFSNLSLPMIPPHLLLAMQSNLPPEKVREMLTEQAEMLDQMASKIKNSKDDDLESVKASVSKRTTELEKDYYTEKKLSPDRKDDLFLHRDVEMLKQELSSVKLREESTYLDLQKAHHQIHMLESQLLELQRKHFSELEHLNFESSEMRRRLEAAEYRNGSLQKENEYLRGQVIQLRRETEERNEYVEPRAREDRSEVYRKEYSPEGGYRKEQKRHSENFHRVEHSPEEGRRRAVLRYDQVAEPEGFRREEPKKKDYMPVRTIVNTSNSVTEALNWKSVPRTDPNQNIQQNLQNKLATLTQEQTKLQVEIDRLQSSNNPNSQKRRSDLELEFSINQSNINSLTAKLRKMTWLSNS